ncbi:MAG TPA: DUF2939 domain-containing protein [Caulobacter sp.]|nr:DUF2939 domain-containing protein [Caulobacter sp.]
MRLIRTLTLTVLAAAALAGCATAARIDAAGDVHALLVAIRDNDKRTFNAHIDREALKSSIEAKLLAEAEKATDDPAMRALGAFAAPYLADAADKALIQPSTFRSLAYQYGYRPGQPIPGQVAIAGSLKRMPDGRVCATKTKNGPCVLIFTQRDGVWKLSGFEGEISDLRGKRR